MAIKVSRIEKEFILKQMLETKNNLEIQTGTLMIQARIEKLLSDNIVFSFLNPVVDPPAVKHADLFIPFRGTRVTCKLEIRRFDPEGMSTSVPEALYRDLDRGFERIEPGQDVTVSLLLEGMEYQMDFPATQEYYDPEPPAVNIKFDAQKITNLLKAFREKALSFSSENRIVMFRERKPVSLPEEIIAWSGRPLLLPLDDNNYITVSQDDQGSKIIDKETLAKLFRSSGKDPVLLSNDLLQHVERMRKRKIWHELYCPVLFRQYVVGYIYLMRAENQAKPFTATTLDFVAQFSRILAYSLQQNDYFQAVQVRKAFDRASLVDISGSGLLFSMPMNGPSLELYADIDLTVTFPAKKLAIKGRVMRRYQDHDRIYIGIKFMEYSDADQEYLLEQLYGVRSDDINEPELPI